MYAVIRTGSKQYMVKVGDVIDVELLQGNVGDKVSFSDVLFFHNGKEPKLGGPLVSSCLVSGELVGNSAGPKIVSVKYKQRHRCYRKFGHRQRYSRVRITGIGKEKGEHHGA